MIRHLLIMLLALTLIASVSATTVMREAGDIGYMGTEHTVRLHVTDAVPGTRLAVSERLPGDVELIAWSVDGARDAQESIVPIIDGEDTIWAFTAAQQDPIITYTIRLPQSGTATRFDGVYGGAPDDFGRLRTRVALAPLGEQAIPLTEQPGPTAFPFGALLFILCGVAIAGACAWMMSEMDMDAIREGGWRTGMQMLLLASSARVKMLVAGEQIDPVLQEEPVYVTNMHTSAVRAPAVRTRASGARHTLSAAINEPVDSVPFDDGALDALVADVVRSTEQPLHGSLPTLDVRSAIQEVSFDGQRPF